MDKRSTNLAAPGNEITLANLNHGSKAFITEVQVGGLLYRRLLDLGFVVGTEVEASMSSPAVDPIIYRIHGADIALRKKDAEQVKVTAEKAIKKKRNEKRKAQSCTSHCAVAKGSNCGVTESIREKQGGKRYTVALAGNPNTGKSTVFNALTGLRQHVGNWPGKSVTRAEGNFSFEDCSFRLIDLPGTYSLLSTSVEEEVARDFVLFGNPDCTAVVVDATCLERNLNLVLQILEITTQVVICLNLMDQARGSGYGDWDNPDRYRCNSACLILSFTDNAQRSCIEFHVGNTTISQTKNRQSNLHIDN